MRKISEYLEHVAECERLAADTPEHKAILVRMAKTGPTSRVPGKEKSTEAPD